MDTITGPTVEIELAGAKVIIPSNTIADIWLDKLRRTTEPAAPYAFAVAPRIGSPWLGGTYMGVVRGEGGTNDHHLIDLGEAPERLNWADAVKWAEGKGGSLPTRREQSVMFGNRAEGQYQQAAYWSSEQSAGSGDCAWCQTFTGGSQYGVRKAGDLRARAVRRLTIQ